MNGKTLLAAFVVLVAAVVGCGGDDCTRAQDQKAACAPPSSSSSSSSGMTMTAACAGFALCEAECVNNATCAQISGNAPAYMQCLAACQGK
jgi:hypothetical protein